MNTTLEPMFAMLGLGGSEILLVWLSLLVYLAVGASIIALVILLIKHLKTPAKINQPVPPVQPPSVASSTEVMPRKCPQCGAALQPDVPEGLCPACLLQRGLGTEGGAPPGPAPFVPPTLSDLTRLFPQLEILELIGKGGMGAVYKARQPALDRLVALKILAPRSGGDLDFAGRFTREARALARLSHPNIVGVYDFGQTESLSYFIMEFVDGPNLRQAGKLSPRAAMEIIPQICVALQFAHDEGIVHRDIKPENVLLDKKGRVKIADFGLAKILGQEQKDFRLTGERDVMGTPHYMAPEQVERPQDVDHRADIYSLGVVFYEMLTGELPIGKFQSPSQKVRVDVRLDEVVLRSLAKEPELRYQHVSEMGTRVETIAGSDAPATPVNAERFAHEVQPRDYALNIRSCVSRGWTLLKNNFWPLVGMNALVWALIAVAGAAFSWTSKDGQTHTTGILSLLLNGPLIGGLNFYFLKRLRGERTTVETAFAGFKNRFLHLFLANFVATALVVLGTLCLVLPGLYLFVAWIFALTLVVDKNLDFWTALELSRKVVTKHWFKIFGFLIVQLLLCLGGVVVFCAGFFITSPIALAAMMYAYEDIFNAPAAGLSGPAAAVVPGRFWKRLAIAAASVGLVIILAMLGAMAIPAIAKARKKARSLDARIQRDRLSRNGDGLIAYWPADGNARDRVNGHDGVILNGAGLERGQVGRAFALNGQNQCVRIPHSPGLIAVNYSVEAWIKPRAQATDPTGRIVPAQNLIFGQSFGQVQLAVQRGTNGARVAYLFLTDHLTPHFLESNGEIPIGEFSHIAATWDGTTQRLYVNGVLSGERIPGSVPMDSGCDFFIGGFYSPAAGSCQNSGQFFQGLVDEVKFYSRALSNEEIKSHYQQAGGLPASNEAWSPTFAPGGQPDLMKIRRMPRS